MELPTLTNVELSHNNMPYFQANIFMLAFGNVNDIVEIIYEKEILTLKNDGAFMGMWQLWTLTNILGRPIRSIFPSSWKYRVLC